LPQCGFSVFCAFFASGKRPQKARKVCVNYTQKSEGKPPARRAGSKAQGTAATEARCEQEAARGGGGRRTNVVAGAERTRASDSERTRRRRGTGAISDSPGAGLEAFAGNRHEGDAPSRQAARSRICHRKKKRGRKAKRPGGFEASRRGRKAPAKERATREALHGHRATTEDISPSGELRNE